MKIGLSWHPLLGSLAGKADTQSQIPICFNHSDESAFSPSTFIILTQQSTCPQRKRRISAATLRTLSAESDGNSTPTTVSKNGIYCKNRIAHSIKAIVAGRAAQGSQEQELEIFLYQKSFLPSFLYTSSWMRQGVWTTQESHLYCSVIRGERERVFYIYYC